MNNRISASSEPVPSSENGEVWEDASAAGESNEEQRWHEMEQVWEDLSSDREPIRPGSGGTPQSGDDAGRQSAAKPNGDVQKSAFSVAVQPAQSFGMPPLRPDSEQGPLGENIRKVRTELLLRHGHRNSSTLGFAIVSTTPGEGRSLIAAELAMSFARLGRSTLLVDADLRHPVLHRYFGLELGRGLIQSVVESEPPELNGIKSCPGLSLLTAGSDLGFDPSELLSNVRFKRLMDSLQNIFEFIIVDTPAFSLYPEAQVVSAVVGRVMTLHRSASSHYQETRSMLRTLAISDAEVLGGVLNHF